MIDATTSQGSGGDPLASAANPDLEDWKVEGVPYPNWAATTDAPARRKSNRVGDQLLFATR